MTSSFPGLFSSAVSRLLLLQNQLLLLGHWVLGNEVLLGFVYFLICLKAEFHLAQSGS